MDLPQDIQLIIKEYSMPIYRRSLHYKAYMEIFNELPIESKNFNVLKYRLKRTDYSNHKIKLANTTYYNDMCRAILLPITY